MSLHSESILFGLFQHEKPTKLKGVFIIKNLEKMDRKKNKIKESEINYSDIPATDVEFWEDATIIYPRKKVSVRLTIDEDIALWLKELGNDSDNAVNNLLRSYFIGAKHFAEK